MKTSSRNRLGFAIGNLAAAGLIAVCLALALAACTNPADPDTGGGSFVAVTNITDVPTTATAGTPLTLSGTVTPSNATNQTITWSVKSAGTTGATISSGNTLNTTAAGTVTVTAAIANGTAQDTNYTKDFTITVSGGSGFVAVTDITGVVVTATVGTPLTLNGTVTPSNATNKTISWSVVSGSATVSGNTLNATAAGTVTVKATIANGTAQGTNYTKDFTITVSGGSGFVAVTDITGVATTATAGTSLTLSGTVTPSNATNRTITWSVKSAGTTGATISSGSSTLNTTAAGTVTVTATIANGTAVGTPYTKDFTITVNAANIDPLLIGTWRDTDTNGEIMTVTFASGGITWGGSATEMLNMTTAIYQGAGYNFVWIAKDGNISYRFTIAGNTTTAPVYGYTINTNGELELSVGGYTFATLVKDGSGGGFVAVTDITNGPATATAGTPLTLSGTVTPGNATNRTITWSVKSAGTTGASISGSTLNTTAAGTVTVTATIVNGLTASTNYTKDFTITVSAANQTPIAGDFNISGTTSTYDGNAKTVTISPKTGKSAGAVTVLYNSSATEPVNAGTYTVTFNVEAATGWNEASGLSAGTLTINKKPVTITGLGAANKVYDGSANATITGTAAISGVINGDNLTVNAGTAAFTNKNAGTAKTVTFSGYTLGGTAANNYNLSAQPASVTANITPLQITIAIPTGTPTKVYDGTTAYTGSGITIGSLTNVVSGDTVSASVTSATYNSANVASANQITIVYAISGTNAANYLAPINGTIAATITKADGAGVTAPTAASKTINSITVNAVTAPVNGQTVEYAVGTANDETGLSAWQSGTAFSSLSAGTTYYVYARSKENDNYNEGTASVSTAIITIQSVESGVIAYYWVNEQDVLATTDNTGNVTLSPGQELTITAQGAGYTNHQWHLNGKNTGITGNTYTFSSTIAGKYTVGLFVEKGGKYYNANFAVTVEE